MQSLFNSLGGNMNLLNPQDLAANLMGEISEAQNRRLNLALGWGQGCSLLIFFPVMLMILAGFTFVFLVSGGVSVALLPLIVVAGITFLVFINLVPGVWQVFSNTAKLKRDYENRAIRQAQGQLAFDKNGYVFKTADRNLLLPSAENTGGLLPGATYRVFYLEESGFLLSAEEVFPVSPAQARAALTEILAQANGFTLEDLAANRNGEVTSSQRMKPLAGVLIGMLIGLAALAFGSLLFFQVFPNVEAGEALTVMVVPALVLGVFVLIGGWMVVGGLLDMSVSSLEQAQGPGRKEKRTSRGKNRSTYYYYVIGGKSFRVTRRAYTALMDGLDYRIYYLPRTKKLVSIEPLDIQSRAAQS